MKIALVSPYDFSYPGGVVRHVMSLENNFTRMGHVVKIIAPASRPVDGYGDRFIAIGKPRPIPTSGSIARVPISFTMADHIKEVLDKEKFDIVHLHEPLAPMLCVTVLRVSNSVNIGTFHATESKPSYRWSKAVMIKGLLEKWSNRLDGRIAVSKPARDYINKYFPANYDIIPNGIDLQHFRPDVEPMPQYQDGKFNILFVGRIEKRKGLEYLIKAYKLIKPDCPDIRLIIVGPGTRLRGKYEKSVIESGVPDVEFLGNVDYKDLPRYYKTADVFCAPATGHESFGIVLLEAMATGRPVIASDISGYASVISDGVDGILVPPKQEVPLAQAITGLMRNRDKCLQLGECGRTKSSGFSWEKVSRKVMDYYTRTLISRTVRV